MGMIILIVEDSVTRAECLSNIFAQYYPEAKIVVAHLSSVAIRFLQNCYNNNIPPDIISLDYDLGFYDTSAPVVNFITARAPFFAETKFYVHSLNPVGANWMLNELRDNGLMVSRIIL